MRFLRASLILSALVLGTSGCTSRLQERDHREVLIEGLAPSGSASTAANLMATAIKEVHGLDVVFYPRNLVRRDRQSVLSPKMTPTQEASLLALFPDEVQDQFRVGTMRGSEIKELLLGRASELYETEVDTAGLSYHVHFIGGFPQFANFSRPEGQKLDDRQYYRVAISHFFYFSSPVFPGYKYRNGLNSGFRDQGRIISAKESLREYLRSDRLWPDLKERRASVTRSINGREGFLPIHRIQGPSHRSPYYGREVTTEGIVTAVGSVQWYPGGIDVIIQSREPDQDPRTSEGLHVYLKSDERAPEIGDLVRVRGVVYEHLGTNGLGMTSLREISSLETLASGQPLPDPIVLGRGGRAIPDRVISSFRGNLNLKTALDLNEGIDFWESLEGMRIQIQSPQVVGFRGGLEEFESLKPKSYMTLFVRPDGDQPVRQLTKGGGIVIDETRNDFNPEILQISTNHLSRPVNTDKVFNVGTRIEGSVRGVLVYERSMFGSGEFNLVLPEEQDSITEAFKKAPAKTAELHERPVTRLVAGPDELTVATFNIENLGGSQKRRLQKLAEAIEINLKCPDILNLVEVQDENGVSFTGGSAAERTLLNLIELLNCGGRDYRPLNIDPVNNSEGGQPGGNIRVAMIYDAAKVGFTPRRAAGALTETVIGRDGRLMQNPGRVFPNAEVFQGTRKSLVAEFTFRGEQIIVIANHFNSKLGDSSMWSAVQPPAFLSENRRILIADRINDFIEHLALKAPKAHVIVAGDFNAYLTENSMRVLEGQHLKNLLLVDGLVPPDQRYTTNYNGNSQAIDFIFVNRNLLNRSPEVEVLNINSDFMGRLSDHDPVISKFKF